MQSLFPRPGWSCPGKFDRVGQQWRRAIPGRRCCGLSVDCSSDIDFLWKIEIRNPASLPLPSPVLSPGRKIIRLYRSQSASKSSPRTLHSRPERQWFTYTCETTIRPQLQPPRSLLSFKSASASSARASSSSSPLEDDRVSDPSVAECFITGRTWL